MLRVNISIPKPEKNRLSSHPKNIFKQRKKDLVSFSEKGKERQREMVWLMNHHLHHHQLPRWNKARIWAGTSLIWLIFMWVTPKISHSPKDHLFADMRNFLGVPNTWNVITNFPFLVVGVLGFVLCVKGEFFNISLRGEVWGWALFYAGITGVAFGSAYYHLKPCDGRVMWDTLPMMMAYSSLFSSCLIERVGEKIGLTCLFALILAAFLSTAYERFYNDLRLCMMFQLIPSVAISVIAFVCRPKYTHSSYWFWATGVYLISKFEAIADKKIYNSNHYFVSGHSLGHLCSALVPVLLSVMLIYRTKKCQRLGETKERP